MCKGCFDGKRTFFVMNHRCKLAAYAYAGDESNENTSASQEEVEDCGEEERRHDLSSQALPKSMAWCVSSVYNVRSSPSDFSSITVKKNAASLLVVACSQRTTHA